MAFVGRLCVLVFLLLLSAISPALAQCDTVAPAFTAFSFTPSAVNTTASSQNVTCTISVTDALSGATSVGCSFQSPSFQKTVSCSSTTPTAGTPQNGTYSCVATLPRYAEAGIWKANLSAGDAVGNNASLSWFLFPGGWPTDLTVTSDPDTIPPSLTGFSINPTSITTSTTSQNVTCTMNVSDAKSGVGTATCFFSGPAGTQTRGCSSNVPSAGTRNSGTFTCAATFPRYSDAGTWTTGVFLVDQAGNFFQTSPANTLAVTSVPEDVTGPSDTGFSFNPAAVSTGSSSQQVTCTMPVADSPAGVDVANCSFSYTDQTTFTTYTKECSSAAPSSGTRNSGTFTCQVVLPRYSPGGAWLPDTEYVDLAGNSSGFTFAVPLTVSCSGADPETTVRFDTKTVLAWTAIAGASRYNIYRGNVSGLVDANLDHLPDGGYGTCQNARDPNLTDLAFTDADVPTAGQKGFHYLVSYTSGGVEKGLGANSFGTARTVAPCP